MYSQSCWLDCNCWSAIKHIHCRRERVREKTNGQYKRVDLGMPAGQRNRLLSAEAIVNTNRCNQIEKERERETKKRTFLSRLLMRHRGSKLKSTNYLWISILDFKHTQWKFDGIDLSDQPREKQMSKKIHKQMGLRNPKIKNVKSWINCVYKQRTKCKTHKMPSWPWTVKQVTKERQTHNTHTWMCPWLHFVVRVGK